MDKINMNLPVFYSAEDFDNERFMKLRVKVMHAGLNVNNSNFNMQVIEAAKPTLANIPLLAFIRKIDGDDSNSDFTGHEVEIKVTENGAQMVYLGRPIGIIPESNNYAIEQDEDGKLFVVVDAYVWKHYANAALDILNRDKVKKVSMEILVDDYEFTDDFVDIKAYKYIGVALLGEDVREGMLGAKAEIVEFSMNDIRQMMEELRQEMANFAAQDNYADKEVTDNAESVSQSTEFTNDESKEKDEVESAAFDQPADTEQKVEADTKLIEYQAQLEELKTYVENLEKEIAELKAYKQSIEEAQLKAKKEALFAEFDDLDEEELSELRNSDFSYEELEIRLFALRGKKVKNKMTKVSIGVDSTAPTEKSEPIYADLVRRKRKN